MGGWGWVRTCINTVVSGLFLGWHTLKKKVTLCSNQLTKGDRVIFKGGPSFEALHNIIPQISWVFTISQIHQSSSGEKKTLCNIELHYIKK